MRIGILTIQPSINYGGILQAYALQQTLENLGHEASVIFDKNRHFLLPQWKKPFVYGKRYVQKYFLGKHNLIINMEVFRKNISCQNTERFIQNHIHICNYSSLRDIKWSDFDAYVVGSDQIWRPDYVNSIENSYLSFTRDWNVLRIAYAASFGADVWNYSNQQTKKCRELAQKFNAVSVRERSGIELARRYLGIDAVQVLDPTLLFERDFYINLINDEEFFDVNNEMMCYTLDKTEEVKNRIADLSRRTGLRSFELNSKYEDRFALPSERIQPSVEKWLQGFYHAKLIVTDSFHATVFSIIFGKPFVVLGNEKRGNTRFLSLLNMVGFDTKNGIFNKIFTPNKTTTNSLDRLRKHSISFLTESLTLK